MKVWKVTFKGLVQGVCFRYNVIRFFESVHPSTPGVVRNMPNGDVEVLLQGDENIVLELKEYCRSNIRAAKIIDVHVDEISTEIELPHPFRISV